MTLKPGNLIGVIVGLVLALLAFVPMSEAQEIPAGVEGYRTHVAAFFQQHCVRCHGPEASKGKITVHALDGDLSLGQELERWETILDVLEFGEMPPEGEPQPSDAQRQAVATWIESGLRDYVAKASQVAAEPTTRRLTNVEYQNTLGDLLGFDLNVIDRLPEDPIKPYHFNNTADLMRIGPEQIDRYLEVARYAMASAIVDPGEPEVHKSRSAWDSSGVDRGIGADEIGVWGNRRNTAALGMGLRTFPEHGEFRIRFQASAILPAGYEEVPLRIVMGYPLNRNLASLQIEPVGTVRLSNSPDDPRVFEFVGRIENFPVEPVRQKDGRIDRVLHITPQNLFDDGTLNDQNDFSNTRNIAMPRVVLNWIEFEGPLTDTWPPAHHSRILFDSPLIESNPDAYIRQVLERFMSGAYRRPATAGEVDRFARIYALIRPDMETMEAAVRETLAMVLISPQFLYHTESDPSLGRHFALASKLSYFLWASMPDEQLLTLAASGELDDPAVIQQQVLRMLADERSADFIENFTMQWLSLQKMKTVPINRDLFPRFLYYVPRGERAGTEVPYLPTVRDYMIQETVGFVGELVRRNASVMQIVDSDFAYLNQRLAAHYGIEGVAGDELRPVPIKPEDHLGGLLTQASVLIGNGTGTAPHPIYRAVWLREAILGDVVAPPPAEVPALTDTAGESAENALSIAELLAQHRQVESCNDCHVRLDPWGIPFERYNAIGQYQPYVPKDDVRIKAYDRQFETLQAYKQYLDSVNTVEVKAQARVPHGPKVDGMRDLKEFLLDERRDDVAENVIRRLLTYGLGRELTYRDRFVVEQLLEQAEKNEYKLRDMIVSICLNEIFRDHRSESE